MSTVIHDGESGRARRSLRKDSKQAAPLLRGRLILSSLVLPTVLATLDSIAILSAGLWSYFGLMADQYHDSNYYLAALNFVWLATIILLYISGLYRFDAIMRPFLYIDKLLLAFMTTILFLLAAAFSLKISAEFSRLWIATFLSGAFALTALVRAGTSIALNYSGEHQIFSRNLVIVAGAKDQTKSLLEQIKRTKPRFVAVLGVFTLGDATAPRGPSTYPILGPVAEIVNFAKNNRVDDVVLAMPWAAVDEIAALMEELRALPVNVYLATDLVGFRFSLRSPPEHFDDLPVVELMGCPLRGWGAFRKSLLDYGLGIILAIILFPVMTLIAIAIKLESPGPVLFLQKRYGFVNREFFIHKFRTMAHRDGPEAITIQATRNDPRVTRVGRFLRRTSLDELPQIFDVLRGDMSLVGPRPHAADHNEFYSQEIRGYFARHRVKPGMTGWAQVNGLRGETKTVDDMKARVRLDIEYVENWSLLFDLKILAMTVFICMTGRNSY